MFLVPCKNYLVGQKPKLKENWSLLITTKLAQKRTQAKRGQGKGGSEVIEMLNVHLARAALPPVEGEA